MRNIILEKDYTTRLDFDAQSEIRWKSIVLKIVVGPKMNRPEIGSQLRLI